MADWNSDALDADGLRDFERSGQSTEAFDIALVRFTPHGRIYPVNCPEYFRPGEQVLVRMERAAGKLATATIVENKVSRTPCQNGVVCRAEDAEWYGNGPSGVKNRSDLEEFLTKHGWVRFSVEMSDYISKYRHSRHNRDVVLFCERFNEVYVRPSSRQGTVLNTDQVYLGSCECGAEDIVGCLRGYVTLPMSIYEFQMVGTEGLSIKIDQPEHGRLERFPKLANAFEAAAWWTEGDTIYQRN